MKSLLLFILLIAIPTQAQITVLEIDTGVYPHKDFKTHIKDEIKNNFNYEDHHGHGTHIAGLILKYTCKEVELTSCKYTNMREYDHCMFIASINNFDFINISGGGLKVDEAESLTISKLKGIVITAAGNDNKDLLWDSWYPANYLFKNIITVGSIENNYQKAPYSNYGLKNMKFEAGTNIKSTLPYDEYGYFSGTSQSAAIYTNYLLLKKCAELHKKH